MRLHCRVVVEIAGSPHHGQLLALETISVDEGQAAMSWATVQLDREFAGEREWMVPVEAVTVTSC